MEEYLLYFLPPTLENSGCHVSLGFFLKQLVMQLSTQKPQESRKCWYHSRVILRLVSRTMHARVFVLPCCCCCLLPCCFGDLYGGFLGQFV